MSLILSLKGALDVEMKTHVYVYIQVMFWDRAVLIADIGYKYSKKMEFFRQFVNPEKKATYFGFI